MDKPLSQAESKLVSDWLRTEYKIPVSNSLIFWRKRPAIAAEWINVGWHLKVTGNDVSRAAGRDVAEDKKKAG